MPHNTELQRREIYIEIQFRTEQETESWTQVWARISGANNNVAK